MHIMQAVQLRIHQLRRERGLSVNGLAARCGINQSTLQNIVGGNRSTTSISTIQKLCDGLEIDMTTFFDSELFAQVEQAFL